MTDGDPRSQPLRAEPALNKGPGALAENQAIARIFEAIAELLEQQGANPYRVDAYRRAPHTLRQLERPIRDVAAAEGLEGLVGLPAIGESLARAIMEFLATGRLRMLDRLQGETDPEAVLASVPGIGRVYAERIHRDLGISTVEDLAAAARDGRLALLPRFGGKRLEGVRAWLASRAARYRRPATVGDAPPVAEILDVDREYRRRAQAGELRQIAPRRLNQRGEAWLPIMHTHRGDREYTALFSNTERAHLLGKTHDWVVVHYDGGDREGQHTVITSQRGALKGLRIVAGREDECEAFYRSLAP